MPAAYDTYDYPAYWEGRDYEHKAELIAIKAFLTKIPKINKVVEIGAGFGRITPTYFYRASKIILTDPASRLLSLAKKKFKNKKVHFLQAKVEKLSKKIKRNSVDLVIMIRVLHHINDLEKALNVISKILKKDGYFILEFANKSHFKARLHEFFKGNFTFPFEIFPIDIRSKKFSNKKTLPFLNYHPDTIFETLKAKGFKIVEIRSVSNIRSTFLKKHLPCDMLLFLEKYSQPILARFKFGPSIFILAKYFKD